METILSITIYMTIDGIFANIMSKTVIGYQTASVEIQMRQLKKPTYGPNQENCTEFIHRNLLPSRNSNAGMYRGHRIHVNQIRIVLYRSPPYRSPSLDFRYFEITEKRWLDMIKKFRLDSFFKNTQAKPRKLSSNQFIHKYSENNFIFIFSILNFRKLNYVHE